MGWGAALGAVTGLLGGLGEENAAKQQAQAIQDAANKYSSLLENLAAPYQQLNTSTVFPQLQALLASQLGQTNQANPYLAAAHQANLTAIDRTRNRGLANAQFAGRTSPSAERGLTLASDRAAQELANRENTGYGLEQQGLQTAAQQRYAQTLGQAERMGSSALGLLSNAGNEAMQGLIGASNVRAQGAKTLYGGLGALAGHYSPDVESLLSGTGAGDLNSTLFGSKNSGGAGDMSGLMVDDQLGPDDYAENDW